MLRLLNVIRIDPLGAAHLLLLTVAVVPVTLIDHMRILRHLHETGRPFPAQTGILLRDPLLIDYHLAHRRLIDTSRHDMKKDTGKILLEIMNGTGDVMPDHQHARLVLPPLSHHQYPVTAQKPTHKAWMLVLHVLVCHLVDKETVPRCFYSSSNNSLFHNLFHLVRLFLWAEKRITDQLLVQDVRIRALLTKPTRVQTNWKSQRCQNTKSRRSVQKTKNGRRMDESLWVVEGSTSTWC